MSADGVRPTDAYAYLLVARGKLLDAVRPLTLAQYTQEFPFARKSIRATLVHMAGGEWFYNCRLRGETIPPPAEQPFPRFTETEFTPFEAAWWAQSEETTRTLGQITDWDRPIELVETLLPEETGLASPIRMRERTTAGGYALQMVLHEVHHRAQVMAMLRHLGVGVEDLDYNDLMFERTEVGE